MPLFPRVTSFFDFFEKHVACSVEGVGLLQDLLADMANSSVKAARIKEVEHEADVITHQAMETLHKTFITPFDRELIHRLLSSMDNILDHTEATAERLSLYDIQVIRPEVHEIARILRQAVDQVQTAVSGLRHLKKTSKDVLERCVDINRLENEGDELLRQGLARLFKEETDPLLVMKWKEIYETLEASIDSCEDVADVIEGIVLENA